MSLDKQITTKTNRNDDAKKAIENRLAPTKDYSPCSTYDVVGQITQALDMELKSALEDVVNETAIVPEDLLLLGVEVVQWVSPLRVVGVNPEYEYRDGQRTDVIRGIRITAAGFGGTLAVSIPGADESTFGSLRRGQRIRFISLTGRLSSRQNSYQVSAAYTAEGIDVL